MNASIDPSDPFADLDVEFLKRPVAKKSGPDRAIAERVSEMLIRIERDGIDAVRAYSRELDDWDPADFRVGDAEVAAAERSLSDELKAAIEFAQEQVRSFAETQRKTLVDFKRETLPGIVLGQRQVPISSVGAYVPAGRLPMLATPFMTVLVAKAAGVEKVISCTPPRDGEGVFPPVLHSIATSGADAIYALGGVQALAFMAFGLGDAEMEPVEMLVGPGNAFVAEAKRQLFGQVGIDLLAGPSEVAVIADDSADPELVAADLLGQAEHGPNSPAILISLSEDLARAVQSEISVQLEELDRIGKADVLREAWEGHGTVAVVSSHEAAARVSDRFAPEHLEVQTERDDWYLQTLRNYGSLFLGSRTTVAFSDKAIGTNHTLPTDGAARYTGGLSVAKFVKTLTWQTVTSDAGVAAIAPVVAEISRADLMPAHEATANKRLDRLGVEVVGGQG